jgi:hypothetical protein
MLNSSTCVDVRRVSTGKIYLFSVQLNACIVVPSVLYTSTAEARAPLVAVIQTARAVARPVGPPVHGARSR